METVERHNAARKLVTAPVKAYRKFLSPLMKPRCIYFPTCSEYFEQAVTKYGPVKGTLKGARRILRCHPFTSGGYDPLT